MASNKEYQDSASKTDENDFQDPDIPDRSYGDYYCKVCDGHMNSDYMWETHVIGKRHIKNVEKGETESKYESLPNVESSVNHELKNVKDPVVGCSFIHEIRRKGKDAPSYYNCLLCYTNVPTVTQIVEHILSLKHRLNYFKEIEPEEHKLTVATNLKKGQLESLVLDSMKKLEEKFGRGTVKVKQETKTNSGWNYSTNKTSNSDDTFRKTLKSSRNDRDNVYKSHTARSSYRERERSSSPTYLDDRFISPPRRNKSPKDFRERKQRYSDDKYFDDDKAKTYFTRKSISPPRQECSPRYDHDDKYLHSSRKSRLCDRMDISTRYENVKSTFDSHDLFQASSSRLPENNQSLNERSIVELRKLTSSQPVTVETVLMSLLKFSPDDCYKLLYERMKTLPEVSQCNELLGLLKVKNAAEDKLRSSYAQKVLTLVLSMNSGSDATQPSSITPESTPKPPSTSDFLSELFKGSNSALSKVPQEKTFSDKLQSSYTPPISSHLSSVVSNYAPSASYGVSPVNSYQAASTSSYTNQAQYVQPNTNVPFASSSALNISQNMASFNPTNSAPSQGRIFNYSHSSNYTLSPGQKQFQRKF